MLEHLARNWGNYASVVGLVFSFLAYVFSKRASQAAREARDSVLKRSLSEDMNDATRIAADITRFVNMQRGDMALLRTGELLAQTSYYLARWDDHLSGRSKTNLRRARGRLLSMNTELTRRPLDEMTEPQKNTLIKACQTVHLIFSQEHGFATKAVDADDSML